MTIQHTHSFVLYNTRGADLGFYMIEDLGLKLKPGQGAAMQRRAINLYLRQFGAMQVQQGSSLFVFPHVNKDHVIALEEFIKFNGGDFVIFDGCGDMASIAASLHDTFNDELDEMDRLQTKMMGQKQKGKALQQIAEIRNLLALNERFMTPEQRERANGTMVTDDN